ncbi:hypothetical protein [uncultured Croceitalea sp.]|uniref:hypothetical protein n=1 Tax=uncultured Croceitalea sp. TaxID=1798908 RepID=UPI003305785C
MEKSIENIWRQEFKFNKELIPDSHDLQNQKSKDIFDRMTRSMKKNTAMLMIFALGFLVFVYFSEAPLVLGILIFLFFNSLALFNFNQIEKAEKINKTATSYEYLIKFRNQLNKLIGLNMRFNRFVYPICMLVASIILWFSYGREAIMEKLFLKFPDMVLINGIPVYFLIAVLILSVLLSVFSAKIYKWEVNLFFKNLIDELEEIIQQMEELKN